MLNTLAALPLAVTMFTQNRIDVYAKNSVRTELYAEKVQAADNSIFIRNTNQEIVLNVPFIHQKDNLKGTDLEWAGGSACGPAAITMALKFNGEDYTLEEVVNKLPTNVYVRGRMFYDLMAGPEQFNYKANEIEINTEQMYKTLKSGNPILLNVQNYDGITGHEVVVVGIRGYNEETKTAKSLIVHDPFRAPYREFEFINSHTLRQPEGYYNPIGIINPFYITSQKLASNM